MRASRVMISAVVLLGASSLLWGQNGQHFSATMNSPMVTALGGPPTKMYVYVDGPRQRVNQPMPGSKNDEADTLILFDKHEQFFIQPYKHTCQESVFPASAASDLSIANMMGGPIAKPSSTTKITHMGTGMAAGVKCDIEDIEAAGSPMMRVWVAKGFDLPVKVAMSRDAMAQASHLLSQSQPTTIDATFKNRVKAQFKPQEKVAFLFLSSISTLEQACGNTLHRACTLAEMIKTVVAPAPHAPGGKAYLGLTRDPRKDPNYAYSVSVSGKRWTATATPRRAGFGGFYYDGSQEMALPQLYYNPSGPATAMSRGFREWGVTGPDYTRDMFTPPGPQSGYQVTMEMTSLRLGRPNPALFVPPSNCQMTKWNGSSSGGTMSFSGQANVNVNASGNVTMTSQGTQSQFQASAQMTPAAGDSPPGDLVTNGGFESGNSGFTSGYAYGNVAGPGTYWVGPNPSQAPGASPDWCNCGGPPNSTGNMMVVNGGNSSTVPIWQETIPVTPNTNYNFSFWGADVDHTSSSIPHLQLQINGAPIGAIFLPANSPDNGGGWVQNEFVWNSVVSTQATLALYDLDTDSAGNDFMLDDITFIPQASQMGAVTAAPAERPSYRAASGPPAPPPTSVSGNVATYGDKDLLGFGYPQGVDPTAGAQLTGLAPGAVSVATQIFGHSFPFKPGDNDAAGGREYPNTDQIFVGSNQSGQHDGYSGYDGRKRGPAVFRLDYGPLVPAGQKVASLTLGIAADDFQFPTFQQPFTAIVNGTPNQAITNQLNGRDETGPQTYFFTAGIDPSSLTPDNVLTLSIDEGGDGGDGFAVDFLTVGVTLEGGASAANLLTNGDFEAGNTGFRSAYTYGNVSGPAAYFIGRNPSQAPGAYGDWCNCGDHTTGTGHMMIVNGGNSAAQAVWEETVPVNPGTTYTFSYWATDVDHSDMSPAQLQVRINGRAFAVNPINANSPDNGGSWQQFTVQWNSGSSSEARIGLFDLNTDTGGNDFMLDDLRFSP